MGGNNLQFSAEDLAEIEVEPTDEDIAAAVEAEDAATNAAMLKYGISPAEIARIRGTSEEEILRPKPTLSSIGKELDELKALRKSDPKSYWADGAQAREAELIAQREQLQADSNPSGEEETTGQGGEIGADLPEELQNRWAKSGPKGVQGAIDAVRSRVNLALGDDGLQTEDVQKLLTSFDDQLDDETRTEIADQLSQDHGGGWPSAKPAEVEQFQATEWGAGLIETWGNKAAKNLGVAKREADAIMMRLGERQRLQLNNWVNGKSATQKRRMVEMLAARAMARL